MRFAALIVLGACSFQPRAARGTGGDGGPAGDARPNASMDAAMIDARAIDAQPDACSDGDNDGVCDDVDDWPCGAKPASPPMTVITSPDSNTKATLTMISVQGAQLVLATPGEPLDVAFHYAITDTGCQNDCIDQLEVGWVPGDRAGCVFDQYVDKLHGESGTASGTFAAPMTPGPYDMRVAIGQNYGCTYMGADTWYHGQPAPSTTIAKVCVH